ncbi:hypothetical protein [Streptomyces radicis]|uniref:Uncharacterized protein n=1 Tax=Streptomyces radicis TaxID=1750517 RepID=A0A3A9VZ92_9ACTN|nr:hypothetical protein [Streptomyces radicis]RKN06251.1 hypothetical protein D7319_22370 [Streptomyces radicis]RKN18581.1 hypothetical protein D7318_21230 [Streptomyces radicis]
MSKFMSRAAATVVGLAVLTGVSVATAGSATAATTGNGGPTSVVLNSDSTARAAAPSWPRNYPSLRACMTAGNTLAQQGKLIGYECVPIGGGHYALITW